MNMFGRLRSAVVIISLAASGVGTAVWAEPASAATASPLATCGWYPANNAQLPGGFLGNGINIRTGPSTACTAVGKGYGSTSDVNVVLRCYSGNWTYITDTDTGVTGWVDSDYLWGPTTDAPGPC